MPIITYKPFIFTPKFSDPIKRELDYYSLYVCIMFHNKITIVFLFVSLMVVGRVESCFCQAGLVSEFKMAISPYATPWAEESELAGSFLMDPGMRSVSIPPHYAVSGFHHMGKWSLGLQVQWMQLRRNELIRFDQMAWLSPTTAGLREETLPLSLRQNRFSLAAIGGLSSKFIHVYTGVGLYLLSTKAFQPDFDHQEYFRWNPTSYIRYSTSVATLNELNWTPGWIIQFEIPLWSGLAAGASYTSFFSWSKNDPWMRVTRIEERVNMGHVSDNDYSASEYRVRGPMGVFSTWITYSLNIEKK